MPSLALRKVIFLQLLLSSLAFVLASVAWGQSDGGDPLPPFTLYNTNHGLSQVDVNAMTTDADGYLWLATMRGLNRFDGKQFVQWTANDGLRINNQTAVTTAGPGHIWLGDVEGGLSQLRPDGSIKTYPPPTANSERAEEMAVVEQRVYLSLDEQGLWFLDPATQLITKLPHSPSHISQLVHHQHLLFVRDDRDIHLFDTRAGEFIQQIPGRYEGMAVSPKGEVWFGDEDGGLWQWSLNTLTPVDWPVYTKDIDRLAIDANDQPWIKDDDEFITPAGQLLDYYGSSLDDLLLDKDGVVWLSSEQGLLRYLGDRFQHYPLRSNQAPFLVRTIAADAQGRLWFAGDESVRIVDPGRSLTVVDAAFLVDGERVSELLSDQQGQMLLAVSDKGIYQLPVDLSAPAKRISVTKGMRVTTMRLDKDRQLWFGTRHHGLMRLDLATHTLKAFDLGIREPVGTLELLPSGGVLATVRGDGIYQVSEEAIKRLPVSDAMTKRRFMDIHVTDAENFLVGAEEGGLYEIANGKLIDRSVSALLRDLNIYVVHRQANGTILAGTENGLFHIDTENERWFQYTQLQGLLSLELNSEAIQVDQQGHLWIGTIDGATRVAPNLQLPPAVPIKPTLRPPRRVADGEPLAKAQTTTPADGGVIFDFYAVSTARPESIEYSYQLGGLENRWSAPTTNPSVRYANLPAGDFEFKVRARFHGDQWSAPVALSLNSLPHFWQRPWFVALMALAVLIATVAVHQLRVRRISAANRTLREKVDQRTSHLSAANASLKHEVEERKKSEATIIAMERQIRSAFDNAPIGMAMVDADGNVFQFNSAFGALFGLATEQQTVALSRYVWDHDAERFATYLAGVVEGQPDINNEEFDCRRSDDEKLRVVFAASVVRNAMKQFSHALLQVQDITQARVLTDRLEYQANFDELTGLHNRRAFQNALRATLRHTQKKAGYLLYMDLDQFKIVNDTCGHGAGDELLRRVADVLTEQVRSGDVVGRLGGDEFGIVLPGSQRPAAEDVAERIRQAIEDLVFSWNGSTFRIGVSIGAVPIQSGADLAELQQLADAACYSAKEAGRNQVHIADGENSTAQMHRGEMRWVQRLGDAIEHDHFVLYGQHLVPLQPEENQPERVEVLVRMRDPQSRRLVPPGAFLPAAERYNMSVRLDEWVVEHLLDALVIHSAVRATPRRYWVNLSGTSIGDPVFAERVLALMTRTPLPPGMVNFEITETAVIQNLDQARKFMQALRDLGCEFALDDFGSGLSSFGYLKKLPVDYVKVDGLFVKNIIKDKTDRMFVKAIIDIAHSLGIKAIAEYVENEEVLKVVRNLGADYAQGFHVHKPEPLSPKLPDKPLSSPAWSPEAEIAESLL